MYAFAGFLSGFGVVALLRSGYTALGTSGVPRRGPGRLAEPAGEAFGAVKPEKINLITAVIGLFAAVIGLVAVILGFIG